MPARGENWPSWRGPFGTGVCAEAGLPLKWDQKEGVVWRVPLADRGNSTPIVWGDSVFVTQAVQKDNRRTLMCFDRADGRLRWQSGVTYAQEEPTNAQNPYCSASPAADGKHVVAYFGSAGLYCYDFEGKEIWHRGLGKVDSWQGSGSSPIIDRGSCFLNAGPGTNAALVACDVSTGRIVWKIAPPHVPIMGVRASHSDHPAGADDDFDHAIAHADATGAGGFLGSWSTPVIVHAQGHDELIVVHPDQVTAYDPATGQEIWICKGLPEQAFASPAIGDGILVASGHPMAGGGTRVTAIKLDSARGDVTATHRLWQTSLPKECVGSGVVAAGRVYLVTQFGSVVCLDLLTGQKRWEKRLPARATPAGSWSSIVVADGKLLIPNQSGEVFVLAADSPSFSLLAANSIGQETTCASLAVSNHQLFLRTYQALWCMGSRGAQESSGRREGTKTNQ
jgi:outer membrane protein assembly factor BamB